MSFDVFVCMGALCRMFNFWGDEETNKRRQLKMFIWGSEGVLESLEWCLKGKVLKRLMWGSNKETETCFVEQLENFEPQKAFKGKKLFYTWNWGPFLLLIILIAKFEIFTCWIVKF